MRAVGRRLGLAALALLLGVVVPYVLAEGVYSLVHGTSLAYELYLRRSADRAAQDPTLEMLTDVGEITAVLDLLEANGVGLGNSPFKHLRTEAAAINGEDHGCLIQKPNLRKTVSFLRSNLFNPFDQMTYFHDTDRQLPPQLTGLFARYGVRPVQLTTNQYGERLTLPRVESADKVLVAGDSIAQGAMLDDAETIPSRLQERDRSRQYVNLGIAGATSADIVCALERAAARYHAQIRELLYVFCENDFSDTARYGTPAELIGWLRAFQQREAIGRVILLYVPYIYNAVPEVTRIAGHSHRNLPTYRLAKQRLFALARQAGFEVVDFLDIANRERGAVGSQFAPLALYVDHSHPSRRGIDRLLPALLAAGGRQ
jgi:hypothetical protein